MNRIYNVIIRSCSFLLILTDKKVSGKSKDEQMAEKKQELEKRLQDVTGQLGTNKKTTKKGECCNLTCIISSIIYCFIRYFRFIFFSFHQYTIYFYFELKLMHSKKYFSCLKTNILKSAINICKIATWMYIGV